MGLVCEIKSLLSLSTSMHSCSIPTSLYVIYQVIFSLMKIWREICLELPFDLLQKQLGDILQ